MKEKKVILPTTTELEKELKSEKYKSRYKSLLHSTVNTLVIVAAFCIIIATLFLPVLQISDTTMSPKLKNGDIVVAIKKEKFKPGDIIAFYYNNRILVKRVIAISSQWVSLDKDGNVYVDNMLLNEKYVVDKTFGESDLDYPYQVPENSYFVLSDQRSIAIDSRNSTIGCITKENIIGKVTFAVWPLKEFGVI